MLLGNNFSEYKRKNMDKLNQVLPGINLTPEEKKVLLWLCGLDHHTVDNMASIMGKMKRGGDGS